MHEFMKPKQITYKYFTPGVVILIALAVNGLIFLAMRLLFGLGAVTNLDNQHPWGIWIAIDVAVGVALAAGGFTSAALGHIMHKEKLPPDSKARIAYRASWLYICGYGGCC